jgi:hypothetical protein
VTICYREIGEPERITSMLAITVVEWVNTS